MQWHFWSRIHRTIVMESFVLEEVVGWIYTLSAVSILTIFFFIAWFENVFPFLPGDTLIVFGGYLAAQNVITFASLWSVTTLGAIAGFIVWPGCYLGLQDCRR